MKDALLHMAASLEIRIVYFKGKNSLLYAEVTDQEWELFEECLDNLKVVFNKEYKKALLQAKSFTLGFAEKIYKTSEPKCPECKKELSYDPIEKRYFCSCGYKGKKVRSVSIDGDSYNQGQKASGRLIDHK